MKTLKVILFISLLSTFTFAKPEEDCQNYKLKLEEARKFFKTYKEVELNLTLRSSLLKIIIIFLMTKKILMWTDLLYLCCLIKQNGMFWVPKIKLF